MAIRLNSRGQVIRVHAYTTPMRKHGGDRQMFKTREMEALDAIPVAPVVYTGPGYIRRRKVQKSI